jgi:APA family basic amino acid/polyamine antiporter
MGIKNQLLAKKSLETLLKEMAGENRLRRVLGPISLTSLGVGAIIGAGIFVMTGRAAAVDAGPAIVLSYVVAGLGCLFAALCYAEFASTVPVAGSAYTYAYATLGELFAWIIGWDLILEYAMACSVVASGWTQYFNEFLQLIFKTSLPTAITSPPFGAENPGLLNLPAVLIMALVTVVLVIGIRESATTNAVLVMIKLGVVLFVIAAGFSFIDTRNWRQVPVEDRLTPVEANIPDFTKAYVKGTEKLKGDQADDRIKELNNQARATYRIEHKEEVVRAQVAEGKMSADEAKAAVARVKEKYGKDLPKTEADRKAVASILEDAKKKAPEKATAKWGILAYLGVNRALGQIDDRFRSPFAPYGLSGIMLGAAIIFFAYIGFDAISTHSEEARRPQRDVPIGIIASLLICTVLYILVSLVITGMEPYPDIDRKAAVAAAFRHRAEAAEATGNAGFMLRASGTLIATGALAGLTSVLLITFLSQARIFLAMARDGLLPQSIFGVVHPRFRTPHRSTMLTGAIICVIAALFDTEELENMVNIGTLMAFVFVCTAVLMLRITRPDAHRPFRAPFVYVVAPLGIGINLLMTLFLPAETWARLVIWLLIGLVFYFLYGLWHSVHGRLLVSQLALEGVGPTDSPINSATQTKEQRFEEGQ